ncbi:MAG: S8 family serine peptidase [Crocinitomicaceae bacterium]
MKTKLLIVFTLLLGLNANSQDLMANREWVRTSPPVVDTILHTASVVDNGNLIVTGNHIDGSGNVNVMTIKYGNNGDTLWIKYYDGNAGLEDYGVDVEVNSSGDVIVAATVQTTSGGYDYGILKYNGSTGNLMWSYIWDGVGNGIDIPADVDIDNLNNIYVTGGSESSSGFSDYGMLKISNSGTLIWDQYYDYVGLHDASTVIIGNRGKVTGVSAEAVDDWDIASVKLNKNTGVINAVHRTDIAGATMVEAHAMATDTLNNVYITGFAEVSGYKYIQTIKLDSNMNELWIQNYDGSYDDVGNDIKVDDAGNVYVTGYTEVEPGLPQAITIKYSPSGTELWVNKYGNVVTADGVIARKLTLDDSGNPYFAGSIENTENRYVFVSYDPSGDLRIGREFEADSLDADAFTINVYGNEVFLNGFSTNTNRRLTSIKYTLQERSGDIVYDDTSAVYTEHELIVKVDPQYVITSEVDDLGKEFWTPDEIFTSTFNTNLNRALENVCGQETCPLLVYRIFKRMRTVDSLSITRSGDTIAVPKFWSTFVFAFPDGVDVTAASKELMTLFPDIAYSTYNLIGHADSPPNDSLYAPEQLTFHPDATTFWPDNHIYAEKAWELETGERWIKIGIIDVNPVDWKHVDFGNGTETTTKVDGWDFKEDMSVYDAPSPAPINSHGTSVAGIVGAIRNNEWGIAGVAGGSYETTDDLDSSGCALYSMNVTFTYDEPIADYIANAVVESSTYSPGSDYGFGLNIMNCSWGISQADPFWFLDTNITLLREAFHYANRNEVTVVASRGNSGDLQSTGNPHDNYPAILDEDWIICVGGTGNDGNYHDGIGSFEYGWSTSRGYEIDVSACSAGSHNWTTKAGNTWNTFNGTSASAPHVTGSAGLLMSYLNDPLPNYINLAPEDVEFVLEITAIDTDFPGYDSLTGWGRVNAGDALYQVHKDKYSLDHFGTDAYPHSQNHSLYSTNDTVTLTERYQNVAGSWFVEGVPYVVNTYKINTISGHVINSNETVLYSWPRPSSSNTFALFDSNNELMPRERLTLDSLTLTQGFMTGYIYQVFDTLGNPLGWWPSDTLTDFDMTYSLLKEDTTVFLNDEEIETDNSISIYPNPTNDSQTLVLNLDQPNNATIRLLDMNGRVIKEIYSGTVNEGRTTFEVDLSNLSGGFYIYSIALSEGEEIKHLKIIKQ